MKLCNYFPILLLVCIFAATLFIPGKAASSYSAKETTRVEKAAVNSASAATEETDFRTEILLKY